MRSDDGIKNGISRYNVFVTELINNKFCPFFRRMSLDDENQTVFIFNMDEFDLTISPEKIAKQMVEGVNIPGQGQPVMLDRYIFI